MLKQHYWGYQTLARADYKILLAYNFDTERYAVFFLNEKEEIYNEKYYKRKFKAIKQFENKALKNNSTILKLIHKPRDVMRISLNNEQTRGENIMIGSVIIGYEIYKRADFKVLIGFNHQTEYYAVFSVDADFKPYYGKFFNNQESAMNEFNRRAKQQNALNIVTWRD